MLHCNHRLAFLYHFSSSNWLSFVPPSTYNRLFDYFACELLISADSYYIWFSACLLCSAIWSFLCCTTDLLILNAFRQLWRVFLYFSRRLQGYLFRSQLPVLFLYLNFFALQLPHCILNFKEPSFRFRNYPNLPDLPAFKYRQYRYYNLLMFLAVTLRIWNCKLVTFQSHKSYYQCCESVFWKIFRQLHAFEWILACFAKFFAICDNLLMLR